jgi:hypothetical protein
MKHQLSEISNMLHKSLWTRGREHLYFDSSDMISGKLENGIVIVNTFVLFKQQNVCNLCNNNLSV